MITTEARTKINKCRAFLHVQKADLYKLIMKFGSKKWTREFGLRFHIFLFRVARTVLINSETLHSIDFLEVPYKLTEVHIHFSKCIQLWQDVLSYNCKMESINV